jgi:hypothetical protein
MTIVPIPLHHSSSVQEYLAKCGEVEVPRPTECHYEPCGSTEPLRKHGSYMRQVIYWGLFFLVQICRFRCKRCGRTVSCPYGWLVPYRRFAAEAIAVGIEAYASIEITYKNLSADLSDLELAPPEMDIRKLELFDTLRVQNEERQPGSVGQPVYRPAHNTVFYWVDFVCGRIEKLFQQLQKEAIQERKRGREWQLPIESVVENPNGYKAASTKKRDTLNRISALTCAAQVWLGEGNPVWQKLRAYFLAAAESRNDVLTNTRVSLPITHTFESAIF